MEDDIMQQETQEEEGGGFLEGWDDDGTELDEAGPAGEQEDVPPGEEGQGGAEEQPEAAPEQPGAEDGGSEPPAGEPGKDAPPPEARDVPAPKTWVLNHMGQPLTISEADVPALAQKGLEYDRIRASYEEARPVMDLFRGFAEQAGKTVPEFVTQLRIQAKQASQGVSEEEARRAVEMEDREIRVSAQEEDARQRQEADRQTRAFQQQRQARMQADIQEFIRVFPDAARDFQNIPQEVWDAVNGGMSLVGAYARYSAAQASAREQAAEAERARREAVQRRNQKNAANSTGSMRSAGGNHGPKDPFMEGFEED